MSDYRVATNDGYVWVSKDDLLEAKDKRIAELQARVVELEAALREITSDELYNEAQMSIIAGEALANSDVEK